MGLIEPGKRVWLGGDRLCLHDGTVFIRSEAKVIRKGEFLIGYAGEGRFGDLLRHAFTPPPFLADAETAAFMATDFMEAVRATLRQHCYLEVNSARETTDNTVLIGVRGHLYVTDSYFSAFRVDAYAAVGSGGPYALGSLHTTTGEIDARRRIEQSLAAAAAHCDTVRAPFDVEFVGEGFGGEWAKEAARHAKRLPTKKSK